MVGVRGYVNVSVSVSVSMSVSEWTSGIAQKEGWAFTVDASDCMCHTCVYLQQEGWHNSYTIRNTHGTYVNKQIIKQIIKQINKQINTLIPKQYKLYLQIG